MQQCIRFLKGGRDNILCVDKSSDFGGHSWIAVANKFTKLQTEKGCYHVDYFLPGVAVPHEIGDSEYSTWPTRDNLLRMFREAARVHGLYHKVWFNTTVEKVRPLSEGGYEVNFQREHEDGTDEYDTMVVSGVCAWPGNLCKKRWIDWPGQGDFGGYITYSSCGECDYARAEGKTVILYGHGAFTIENVRTLLEHRCKKVWVMCRRRNLCGMKVVSWMANYLELPIPGHIMLDMFQKMYNLVGFDVWKAYSVKTDANRSMAHVSQKTVFGVTDVYFLAGYFGLMEVLVDEIAHLTYHNAHTRACEDIHCEMIIKAVGTLPDFEIDRMLGCKELIGFWVNGDRFRPVMCNSMFVEAKNFGSFSSGPGFAPIPELFNWFFDFPQDFDRFADELPRQSPGERPAYVPSTSHMLPTLMAVRSAVPQLDHRMAVIDALKAQKMQESHPPEQYLAECQMEWECYIRSFRDAGMVDDRPDPPYPYTIDTIHENMQIISEYWNAKSNKN